MAFANRSTKIGRKTIDISIDVPSDVNVAGPAGTLVEPVTFRLQDINGIERDHYEMAQLKVGADGKKEVEFYLLRSRLVTMCWIDPETGARCFNDGEVEAFAQQYPSSVIETLFRAAQKLTGMDAGAVDDARKNSASVPADASTSDLH